MEQKNRILGNLKEKLKPLSDKEYAELLRTAISFLEEVDKTEEESQFLVRARTVPEEVICMAAYYLVKELIPIPVDGIGQKKIARAADGSPEKKRELLALYLGTSWLGYQLTGQFAGLSFGASQQELYAAHLLIKTFYDLDHPIKPDPESERIFFRTRSSLWEKMLQILLDRGLINPEE